MPFDRNPTTHFGGKKWRAGVEGALRAPRSALRSVSIKTSVTRPTGLPEELKKLVWFRPSGKLEKDRDAEHVILCTLYLGTMDQIRLMFRIYGRERVTEVVRNDLAGNRMLPESVVALWRIALDIEDIPQIPRLERPAAS
ncbi:MAG: hypothetical protein ACYDGN_12350 [Acidimicrobiales bacterium]